MQNRKHFLFWTWHLRFIWFLVSWKLPQGNKIPSLLSPCHKFIGVESIYYISVTMNPTSIDITNRKQLNSLLNRLTPETLPLWGNLKAQSMVEHLVEAVEYTNGKKTAAVQVSPEEADSNKQSLVHGDAVISKGAKGYLTDATKAKRYNDLPTAIDQLNKEIDAFERFFTTPGKTVIHQHFGAMNREEWITWHGKHFTHHFKQFGLINSE